MREWVIELHEFETEEDFRVAVERELAGLENMGHRLGRGFIVSPLRRPRMVGGVEVFETVGWVFGEAVMPRVKGEHETEQQPRKPSKPAKPSLAEEAAALDEPLSEDEEAELTDEELTEHFPEPVAAE